MEIADDIMKHILNYFGTMSPDLPYDHLIFPNKTNTGPIDDKTVRDIVKKRCREAGISGNVRVHDLRHTAAMSRYNENKDVLDVKEFLGHSSLETTQIYLHVIDRKEDLTGQIIGNRLASYVTR